MDLVKLAADWESSPNLRECAADDVTGLAKNLVCVHRYLMGPESGPFGYLYQRQAELIRELKNERSEQTTGGRNPL